mgnify:CR=1 FL=1
MGVYSSVDLCTFLIEEIGLISVAGEHFNIDTLTIRISLISLDLTCIDYDKQHFNKDKIYHTFFNNIT